MLLSRTLIALALIAAASLAAASPSYSSGGDNAYPMNPSSSNDSYDTPSSDSYGDSSPSDDSYGDSSPSNDDSYSAPYGDEDVSSGGDDRPRRRRHRGAKRPSRGGDNYGDDAYAPKEPCTTGDVEPTMTYAAPTTTPCTTGYAQPTGQPTGSLSNGDVAPEQERRPVCPAPITITRTATHTLPAVTNTVTATRTVHDVRTATQTVYSTATVTATKIKPVVSVSIREKVVEVTKTVTCKETTTIAEYHTKTRTIRDVEYRTVTHEAAALPTNEAKPAYGPVKPAPAAESAYGPVKPYDAGAMPASEDKTYMPTAPADSAYGYNS